jgi:hypothetical protein
MSFSMLKFILICPTTMTSKTIKVDSLNELDGITEILVGWDDACAEAGCMINS